MMANTTIYIKSPKGVLLKTKDKYCENDIAVIPEEVPQWDGSGVVVAPTGTKLATPSIYVEVETTPKLATPSIYVV